MNIFIGTFGVKCTHQKRGMLYLVCNMHTYCLDSKYQLCASIVKQHRGPLVCAAETPGPVQHEFHEYNCGHAGHARHIRHSAMPRGAHHPAPREHRHSNSRPTRTSDGQRGLTLLRGQHTNSQSHTTLWSTFPLVFS